MTYATTMTSKGQITVPAPIRRKLGLQPGDSINIKLKGKTAVVERNNWRQGLADLHDMMAEHRRKHNIKPLSIAELKKLREEAGSQAAIERHNRSIKE